MGQSAHTLEKDIRKRVKLDYLLHLPAGYESATRKMPLILFLHGSGERGDQIDAVKKHGIPKIVEQRDDFPFVTVSPQCPSDSNWSVEKDALLALLGEVTERYSIDKSRIYLTGLSMGGFGTWELAADHPELFAAIAPICGGGNPAKAESLRNTPVWVFHGAKDSVVPLEKSTKMAEAVEACGGHVKLTIYPEADHNSWTEAYNNPELYDWFLQHSLDARYQ